AVIVVLLVSIGWGAWRGMVHEVLSLAGWVLAFFAANLLTAPLAGAFPAAMRPEIRVLVAFLLVFVGTLVVATLATTLFTRIVKVAGLRHLDRWLGAHFGLVRGFVFLVAFVLLDGLTPLQHKSFWTDP